MDMLSEHQGRQEPQGTPANYDASPEERKLVKRINSMFQKAKAARGIYDQRWSNRQKFYRGKQWETARASYRNSEVVNISFQAIQAQVPIMTDSRPKFEFMPQDPSDRPFSEFMNDILSSDWERNNWLFKLTEMLYDGHVLGTGICHLGWDQEAEYGAGAICFKPEELHFMFPDPDATDIPGCDYIIRAEAMNIRRVQRKYPEKARYIKGDTQSLINVDKTDLLPIRVQSPVNDRVTLEGTTGSFSPANDEKVLVLTAYYRDSEVAEAPTYGDGANQGESSYKSQKLKYPMGRKTVVANGIILQDDHNDMVDGSWPWQRWVNYIAPHEFWGISELEPIEGPQRIFNKIFSWVLDCIHLTGNPIWVVDTSSGIDTDNLTNAPGLVVEKNPGSEVRREAGTQLQPYILSIMENVKQWIEQLSGSQDVSRGITAPGVTAASAIADLQNAAHTRIRQKSRNLDAFLQDMGQGYCTLALENYTAPRVFRVTNRDGSEKYFKAYITKNGEGKYVARRQGFNDDGSPSAKIDEFVLRGKLDLRVNTGTSLPINKAQKKDLYLSLFDRGVIPRKVLLKEIDLPNWEAIEDEMVQQEQAAAQAAQTAPPQA